MILSVLVTLGILCIYNAYDMDRFASCIVVLLVTGMAYQAHSSDLYFDLVDSLGYYGFLSLAPILSIVILSVIHSRLSTVLIGLYAIIIMLNAVAFWLEGVGVNVDTAYLICGLLTYAIQCALMFSERLTNAVHDGATELYGSVRRYAVARDTKAHDGHTNHARVRTHNHKRNNQ